VSDAWLWSLGAVGIGSLVSFAGASTLALRDKAVRRTLFVLVAFAAGGLLGEVFLHLLPEIAEEPPGIDRVVSFGLLGGMLAFFVLEKVLHWHHSHLPQEEVLHPVAVTNLVGDALHNLIDGAIIAGAFQVSTALGITTTIAVVVHEIPQELGDFAILVHAGMAPRRALLLNLLSSLAAFIGAVTVLVLGDDVDVTRLLLPVTAGGFLYLASTDLLPELHKEPDLRKSLVQLTGLLSGVAVMVALLALE
jgi:zinc and cadmium transporter